MKKQLKLLIALALAGTAQQAGAQLYIDGPATNKGGLVSDWSYQGVITAYGSYSTAGSAGAPGQYGVAEHRAPDGANTTANGNGAALLVNGSYDALANGRDYFYGPNGTAGTQSIGGTTAPQFGELYLRNGSTQMFSILNDNGAVVGTKAYFENGITTTRRSRTATGSLRFLDGAAYSSTAPGDAQFVDGYVSKRGVNPFIFPVGQGGDIRTLSMSAPAAAATEISVAWIAGNPGTTADPSDPAASALHPVTATGSGIQAVSTAGQWDWIPVTASSNALSVTVSIPDVSSLTATAGQLRLVGWNGSQWVDLSGSAAGANASGVTADNTLSGTVPAGSTITAIGIGRGLSTPCPAPLLSAGNPVCNGITYSVSFSSNGTVTASSGTVSGNIVSGIAAGTAVTLTATAACGSASTVSIAAPASCTTPPGGGCTPPGLTAGQGTCNGTGTYNVSFTASAGATVTASAGTVSGTTVTGIAIGTNVKITATAGTGCSNAVTIASPADCSTPCATAGASFSGPVCNGATYTVNYNAPSGATVTASTGTVNTTAGTISGIAIGTNVTLTVATGSCANQSLTITSPARTAPELTAGDAVCDGATYSVMFASNGTVTASAGTISGNTVTGIATGTNLVLTATALNGCATSVLTVTAPPSCTTPPVSCTPPTINAGQGTCNGNGTYGVSFSFSAGAVVSASAGTISGSTVINIPVGTDVTITATNGTGCSNAVKVASPADCSTPCGTPALSVSRGVCEGSTYTVYFSNPNGATITSSEGVVGTGSITGIPGGAAVTITASNGSCGNQVITVPAPANCGVPDLSPTIDVAPLTFSSAQINVPRDFVVNIYNGTASPTTAPVVFRVAKVSGMTITYPRVSGTSNVYGGTPNENSNWTFTETPAFVIVTSRPGVIIPGNGQAAIGFTITRTTRSVSNRTMTVTVDAGTGGGETPVNNNSSSVTFSLQ